MINSLKFSKGTDETIKKPKGTRSNGIPYYYKLSGDNQSLRDETIWWGDKEKDSKSKSWNSKSYSKLNGNNRNKLFNFYNMFNIHDQN